METALKVIGVYLVGFIIAYLIAWLSIRAYGTKEHPIFAAAFSWLTVLMFVIFLIYDLGLHTFEAEGFKKALKVLKYVYYPIYAAGWLIYTIARLFLALGLLLMLQRKKAFDILKHLFR